MDTKIDNFQWKIRLAIQKLHKKYYHHPWIYLTESDIQCDLYAQLLRFDNGYRKTRVRDNNCKLLKESHCQILTRSLHAELSSSRRKSTEYVDLCLVDPAKFEFWVPKNKIDRHNSIVPVWSWEWKPEEAIGIEIKFNRWVSQKTIYNRQTKRRGTTQKWKNLKYSLIEDLKKLRRYKRGWLIFIDHHSLIRNYAEWRNFVDVIIRESNYGYAKKTLNAYYLCPKIKRAFSYKPPYLSF